MIMIMISYNILQKRLIFQKYKKMLSRKIRHVAIRSGSIRWISIRFDAESLFIQKGKLISKTDLQKRFVVKEAKKC